MNEDNLHYEIHIISLEAVNQTFFTYLVCFTPQIEVLEETLKRERMKRNNNNITFSFRPLPAYLT